MKNRFRKCLAVIIVIATLFSTIALLPMSKVKAEETTRFYDWKQYDPQWKDVYIGSNTIGNIGCYATSAAILIVYGGLRTEADFNPAVFVEIMKKAGGFAGNLIYKGKINRAVPGFDYKSEVLLGTTVDEKTESIKYYLDKGYYIIAGVKNLGHYVAIREVKNGVVYMMDPASEEEVLFNRYASSGVTKIFLYTSTGEKVDISKDFSDDNSSEGSGSFESSEDTSSDSDEYKEGIYQTTDRLNLRQSATTASDSLGVIPLGTELEVTSVNGIWGETTYDGKTGYICLTYTTFISEGNIKDPTDTPSEEPSSEEPSSEEPSSEEPSSEEPSSEEPSVEPSGYVPGTYVTTGALNLREGPTTSTSILTTIPKNTTIEVTEISGKWGKTTYNGKTGYCGLSYAELISPALKPTDIIAITSGVNSQTVPPSSNTYNKGIYVLTDNLRLRQSPTTSSEQLLIMSAGAEIKVIDIDGKWGKVVYNDVEGWCSLEYATFINSYIVDTTFSAENIVATLGNEANLANIHINYTYSDGSVFTVRSDITVKYTIPTSAGTVSAIATYDGAEYTFEILYVSDCDVKITEDETYVVTNIGASSESIFGCSSVELKTGSSVKVDSAAFVVVVIGDVDGSGSISSTDYVLIKQAFLGTATLSAANTFAADVNGDGEITSTDYLGLKNTFTN